MAACGPLFLPKVQVKYTGLLLYMYTVTSLAS